MGTPSAVGEFASPKGMRVILYVWMEELQRILTHGNTSWIYGSEHINECLSPGNFEQSPEASSLICVFATGNFYNE